LRSKFITGGASGSEKGNRCPSDIPAAKDKDGLGPLQKVSPCLFFSTWEFHFPSNKGRGSSKYGVELFDQRLERRKSSKVALVAPHDHLQSKSAPLLLLTHVDQINRLN
jgi:hypothetical protein